jgi:insulin-like growth factor 2 mRNA-binding protein 1
MTVYPEFLKVHCKEHFHSYCFCESIQFLMIFFFVCSAGGKIVLTNLPLHVRVEDLEPLLTPFGSVQNCEKLNSRDGSTQIVQVSYETQEQAQQ